ncbi:MAG: rhodanese-like domain-containing protein [Acidimicrobiales bacterium]|nr:rhodanese-like domain-containing protein [Acidimicrobiales bacterium]
MNRRAATLGAATALALALGLAACGDDNTLASAQPAPTATSVAAGAGAADPAASATVVGADEAAAAIAAGEVVVVDVRSPEEFAAGHVEDALNVDVEADGFVERADEVLDGGDTVLVYCRSGRRSAIAAQQLAAAGWTVLDAGALTDLAAAGVPVTGAVG